ncbi:MAG: T9SS type A sorting domain-containing protein, partial [Chitinophagaceae bacterium]|nr:T9SS type A sorting domain-containing protein [Chitinophagaceae bacterium]
DLSNTTASSYMFEFSPIELSEAASVTLIDNYLKTTTDISPTEASQVYFEVGSDSRSSATDRFCVVITKNRQVVIPGVAAKASIRAYPNPVSVNGNISLQFDNIKAGMYKVELMNSGGQTVYSSMMQLNEGNYNRRMNIGRNLPAGIYQMKITGKDSRTVIKIMRR